MKLVEPPSCSPASAIVFIGRNSRGHWVAQEQNGLYGGLFVNRAQAVKYALFENGHHPETIVELSREIELDMGGKLSSSDHIRAARGHWVAQEQNGLYGGLFVNRAQAVKYALFENGHHPETIVELSREIELDMGGKLSSSDHIRAASTRRVA